MKWMRIGFIMLSLIFCNIKESAGQLRVVYDVNVVHDAQGQPWLWFFFRVDGQSLKYAKVNEDWYAPIAFKYRITYPDHQSKDSTIIVKYQPTVDTQKQLIKLPNDAIKIATKPGTQELEFAFFQPNDDSEPFLGQKTLTIDTAATYRPVSDILLIDTAFTVHKSNDLSHDGLQLLPQPLNYYDSANRLIRFAIHHLYDGQPGTLKMGLSRRQDEDMYGYTMDSLTIHSNWIQGNYDLASINSGNYFFKVELWNGNKQLMAKRQKQIHLFNPHPLRTTDTNGTNQNGDIDHLPVIINLDKEFVGKFNTQQLIAVLKMMLLTATKQEYVGINTLLNSSEDIQKRHYIFTFWNSRSPNHAEAEWNKFADTIKLLNKLYGKPGSPGYLTEFAKIHYKYGAPDMRIEVPSEPGALPYEIWQYNAIKTNGRQGFFLFYLPKSEFTSYRLLHSTVPGEIQNYNWANFLYFDQIPNNSRAFQYFR